MKNIALALCFFFMAGCSVTYEYKDFSDCKVMSEGVEFMTSVRSSPSNRGGVNYYGEPYDVRFRLRSEDAFEADQIDVSFTAANGGGRIRDYSGAMKTLERSDAFYAWYVVREEDLPYEAIDVSAEVSGEKLKFKFDCRLYADYKKHNSSLLEAVLGGI